MSSTESHSQSLGIAKGALENSHRVLLAGLGVTNFAVAKALLKRRHVVLGFDDKPNASMRKLAASLGFELIESIANLEECLEQVDLVVPTPGLAETHPLFESSQRRGLPLVSEFDLAAQWDVRPIVAITGTNGKSTVVELCVDSLQLSGMSAVAAGNTDVPLVAAIDDPAIEVFVVEASSFRLARAYQFAPQVGTWINFAANHLDVHSDLAAYEKAKSQIWQNLPPEGVCVANATDPVVMRHVRSDRDLSTFGGSDSDWRAANGELLGPQGAFASIAELWRCLPHDILAALAAAASVTPMGATANAVAEACRQFSSLPHRINPIGQIDGATYYDDSKATTPHATSVALNCFEKVVLIAGGKNKGIDLNELAVEARGIVAVVAIGDSSDEIVAAFAATHQVAVASDMDEAVRQARRFAQGQFPVLLSPGCASFDWYEGYGERGDDFIRAVRAVMEQQ